MKTIHAKGALILNLGIAVMADAVLIFVGVSSGNIEDSILCVIMSILLILIGVHIGIGIYRTHWIQYGNGRVVIRRVSKEIVNGRVVGKWKNREDEILLEEIEAYGLSREILGYFVEFHRTSIRRTIRTTEIFFQLKDGKQIGYEARYYTRKQEQEFFRYIYEGTGLEFQKSKPK